jgi:hypothetical protein
MLFVADEILTELRTIIGFLNKQMDPAEVLSVEIKQYVGEGIKTLVPRIVGQVDKPPPPGKQWDEASFFSAFEVRNGGATTRVARTIYEWLRPRATRIWWGKGQQTGSVYPMFDSAGGKGYLISLWTNGKVEVPFGWMKRTPPFNDQAKRQELLDKLIAIPGIALPSGGFDHFPRFELKARADKAVLDQFINVLEWAVNQLRS